MCTAIAKQTDRFYFGRTMDYDRSFGEQVVIAPRGFPFCFRREEPCMGHYAMIGMASLMDGYPLYADAVNEKGLGMAGLQFAGNAFYSEKETKGKYHVSPFELIPWVLSRCADITEARAMLTKTALIALPFREDIPLSPLHWMIADQNGALVLEVTKSGTHLYDAPIGVLTNNPPFPYHMKHLSSFANLTNQMPDTEFARALSLDLYSAGLGAVGLPGDCSSPSRFVRAAFLREHMICHEDNAENISEFFHLLSAVSAMAGSVMLSSGAIQKTTYSACMDAERGIYYYTSYFNRQITAVNMHAVNLDDRQIAVFPLKKKEQILWE